jgi:glucose-6-phosphate 1-dehydrogenase
MTPVASQPNPCLLLIFGASGDLTHRKLVPAMYDLFCAGKLPQNFGIMGISRTSYSDEAFREHLKPSVQEHSACFQEDGWQRFAPRLHYHPADSTKSEDYPGIIQRMQQLAAEHRTGQNALFYLSVAPHLYKPIINLIGEHHMVTEGKRWCSLDRENAPWQRIVIEKPFGSDPASAADLNRTLGRVFEEESIYRIDHYLGKETVQNMLVFRFANAIFEPIWNRNYIDHIQVTAAETVGVEGRGGYYDSPSGGAMRDMIQSHLLQIMAIAAMEPPVLMRAEDIRSEKTKALNAVRPLTEELIPEVAVKGQYAKGQIAKEGQNHPIPDFGEEKGVNPNSQTDTYAALKLYIDTWRWEGVPFYLRSGKAMAQKLTEIVVRFKPTPHSLFRGRPMRNRPPNQIVMNIQPNEGIRLSFEGKVPGSKLDIKTVKMDFDYVEQFQSEPPEAYATLLLDAMRGDQTLFKDREEIETCWKIVQPVLDYWDANPLEELPNYAAGTWGPSAADVMMARDGRSWHNPRA